MHQVLSDRTELTFGKSYRKRRLLVNRVYEDSNSPCVWHTRARTAGSHGPATAFADPPSCSMHTTVPYFHGFIKPAARQDGLTVFIPVQGQLLARRSGHREHRSGQRRCERIRGLCKGGSAQIEETDGAVP